MTTRSRHRILLVASSLFVLCAAAGIASVASSAVRSAPLVKITKAPLARTTKTEAEFRFRTRAATVFCRRDVQVYRRCRGGVKYTGLRPGRHVFRLRVRHRGRTVFVQRRWTVMRSRTVATVAQRVPGVVGTAPDPGTGAVGPGERALVFADEFGGTALDTGQWRPYDSAGHAGFGLRRPSAVSVNGAGQLVITAKNVNDKIVSGGMSNKHDFTYGRVEFRVRTEPDPTGTMSGVVLTWPQRQWSPEFTENDMYETGTLPNNHVQFDSFIHYGPSATTQKWSTYYVDPSEWHTVAMEWYPNLLEIYVDGVLRWSITDPAVIPDNLHHVCIQLDARATRTLSEQVRMYVDYVRVYQ